MVKVSVILPVYNAEEHLQHCIDSILAQEFEDLELIAVDDGSKDGSPAMLDDYAAKDSRIKVIHKENGGVSSTRNRGLEKAQGEYIQFIDSDDWLPADSTKLLVRAMEDNDCDLVVGDFYRVVGDNVSRKGSITVNRVLTRQEYASWMMESPADYYYGVLWNKLYKRDLIHTFGLRMDPELSFCEDFVFNLEYILRCRSIFPLQVPVYYYVRTEGSLVSQNLNLPRLIQSKTSIYAYYDQFFRTLLDEETYEQERMHIARYLVSAGTDGAVIPLMPGTKKLGSEQISVLYDAADADSRISSSYYMKKAFDHLLSSVALKYNLGLRDVQIFHALRETEADTHQKDLSDYTGISHAMVLLSLQKLSMEGYIRVHYSTDGIQVSFLKHADALSADIDQAVLDLMNLCMKDFTEEEKKMAEDLNRGVYLNLRRSLEEYEQ